MNRTRLSLALVTGTLALGVSCGSGDAPPPPEPSADVVSASDERKPWERPDGPETEEEIKARLNLLPAYEDRTEPYPGRVWADDVTEMFPADIRERYELLFTEPIPRYVVGVRGNYRYDEKGRRSSGWLFNVPQEHLEDFRRHLIEDLGVPERALTEQVSGGGHSAWVKRDLGSRSAEVRQLEEVWAAADGGLRFIGSTLIQVDYPSLPITKGSPVLHFENHSNTKTFPQMTVDLNSGQVGVSEEPVWPD